MHTPDEMPAVSDRTRYEQIDALRAELMRVLRALHHRIVPGGELADVPFLQFKCLNSIASHEGHKMVDLANRTGVALPGVSRAVDKLVQRGLVLRNQDPTDRRAVRLFVTERARQLMDERDAARTKNLELMANGFNAAEIADILEKVTLLADAGDEVFEGMYADFLPDAAPNVPSTAG